MKIDVWMKGLLATLGSAFLGLMLATVASAANPEPVPVEVEWIAPITIVENNPLQFGMLDVGMATNETVTINTDDSFSESTAGTVVGGTQAAAQVTVTSADSTPISILVDNFTGANYYTLGTWLCNYESGGDNACDVAYNLTSSADSSSGDPVEIGATLTKNATPAIAGADDITFDVTVTYQ